jgi:hypothetical protein
MPSLTKVIPTMISLVLTIPIANAQAPAPPTAFDGQYTGVSAQVSKSRPEVSCPGERTPDSLSIAKGHIGSTGSYRWSGTVSADGSVVIRNKAAMRVNGNIDSQGTITGEFHGAACNITYVWRKQPG